MDNSNKNVEKKLFKSSYVAQLFGVTPMTLKNWTRNGLIEAVTINTHRYYTQEAIDAYIERSKKKR